MALNELMLGYQSSKRSGDKLVPNKVDDICEGVMNVDERRYLVGVEMTGTGEGIRIPTMTAAIAKAPRRQESLPAIMAITLQVS